MTQEKTLMLNEKGTTDFASAQQDRLQANKDHVNKMLDVFK